jgi:hypothetical protein
MNRFFTQLQRRGVITAAALCLPLLARANTPQVEVRGQTEVPSPRQDVRSVCPGIDERLPDEMVNVVRERGEAAQMQVRFTIQGQRISGVQAEGGPAAYQRRLTRIVRNLPCSNGSANAPAQSVSFRVLVLDPYAPGGNAHAGKAAAVTVGASAASAVRP